MMVVVEATSHCWSESALLPGCLMIIAAAAVSAGAGDMHQLPNCFMLLLPIIADDDLGVATGFGPPI